MLVNIQNMEKLLVKNHFISNENNITQKGLISSCISEVNELMLSESIESGLFDNLEFEEIVAFLCCFLNEKDQNNKDIYLSTLNIPNSLKVSIDDLINICEHYEYEESNFNIQINTDFNIYLDFVEPVYVWANNGTMQDIFNITSVYEGNFVKLMLRINNLLMNIKDLFSYLNRFDLLKKIENFEERLLRDEVSVQSIYIDGI